MSKKVNKGKKSDLQDLINKYLNAKGNEKKLLLLIIKRKNPDFKE
jgi:hypothetical protein